MERHQLNSAIDSRLRDEGIDIVKGIRNIEADFSARGFSILPGAAFEKINALCIDLMKKTVEVSLSVFSEKLERLNSVEEKSNLQANLSSCLQSQLRSIAQTAKSSTSSSSTSNFHELDMKHQSLLAAAQIRAEQLINGQA